MSSRVDYDSLAPTYNLRFGQHDLPDIAQNLLSLAGQVKPSRILEVGCGTGRWLQDLAQINATQCSAYGLDLSAGMLKQSLSRQGCLHLAQGNASCLPYAAGSFQMVYCVNALHHFSDPRQFIQEARRLLLPGGAFCTVGRSSATEKSDWFIYEYFEGAYDTDLVRFPAESDLLDWLDEAGFKQIRLHRVVDRHALILGRAVLNDLFIQKSSCSQLALLSEDAYTAGLGRMKADLAEAEKIGERLVFSSNLKIDMITGWVF